MDERARQRIKDIVNKLKVNRTQGQIALALGVSPGTVRNWADGISVPDLDGLVAIAKTSGIAPVRFLSELVGEELSSQLRVEKAEDIVVLARELSSKERLRVIGLLALEISQSED